MKKVSFSSISVVAVFALTISCLAAKCGDCNELARVDDSRIDGCGTLLETEGQLLMPVNLEEYNLTLLDGDTVSISYTSEPDGMSICMRESAIVKLTCIELVNAPVCEPLGDPVDQVWSRKALSRLEPYKIDRYTVNSVNFYRFYSTSGCTLFRCDGRIVCSGPCADDPCADYFRNRNITIDQSMTIYVQDK